MPVPAIVRSRLVPSLLALALSAGAGTAQDGLAGAYLAARQAAIHNDFAAAAQYYAEVLTRDPDNARVLDAAVSTDIALGKMPLAIPIAKRMAAAGMKSQAASLVVLTDLLAHAAYDQAVALIADGHSIGALVDGLVTGWADVGAGRMSDATAAFEKLAAAPGLKAFGLYHKALALASAGDFEGAETILSGQAGADMHLTRRGVIARAEVLSQLERNKDALDMLNQVFGPAADPGIDALRKRLEAGETLPFDIVRNARDGLAEVFFTVATALNGQAADNYTLIYARIADYLRPDHADALLLTAKLLEALGQNGLATDVYNDIPRDDPSFYQAEMGRADALYASGRKDAAVEVLLQLSKSFPNVLEVQVAYGDMLRREQRFAEATTAYDKALTLVPDPQPEHWGIYYMRGITEERTGNWDKAEPDFREALQLNPGQPQVLNYLGYALVERNEKLDEALAMIEQAVKARPDDGYIVDSLAWVLYRLGRYSDALPNMERASQIMPVDPVVTDHLGDVYWAVGRKLEAQFQWRRALSFGPEEKDAARIRDKLAKGLDAVLKEEGAPPLAVSSNGG